MKKSHKLLFKNELFTLTDSGGTDYFLSISTRKLVWGPVEDVLEIATFLNSSTGILVNNRPYCWHFSNEEAAKMAMTWGIIKWAK
jgi:hypothetical protein